MLDRNVYYKLKKMENPTYGISMKRDENDEFHYVIYERGKGLNYSVISLPTKDIKKIGNFVYRFGEELHRISENTTDKIDINSLQKLYDDIRDEWLKTKEQKSTKGRTLSFSQIYKEVSEAASVRSVMEAYNIHLQISGKNIKAVCCFHDDHDPSLHILPNDKGWICFVCHEKGNAIQFVQKYENIVLGNRSFTVQDAVNKVIDICNLNIEKIEEKVDETKFVHNYVKYNDEQIEKLKVFEKLTQIGTYQLLNGENEALQYLEKRGFTKELINQMQFGWIPKELVQSWINSEQPPFDLNVLEEIGFIHRNQYGDLVPTYGDRVLIPLQDEKGNTVTFSGRAIRDEKPKYLLGKSTDLFQKDNHLYHYQEAKRTSYNDNVFVVEGFMDAIAGEKIKNSNLVATMGTSISNQQLKMLKRMNANIILCRDNDEAGKNATVKEIHRLQKENISVQCVDIQSLSEMGKFSHLESKKDLWDLVNGGMTNQDLNEFIVTGLEFVLKYEYFKDKEITPDSIYSVYLQACHDGIIKNKKDEEAYIQYIRSSTAEIQNNKKTHIYSVDDVRGIIHEQNIEKQPILSPLYKTLLKDYIEKGVDQSIRCVEEYAGLFFDKSTKNNIKTHLVSSFYEDPELYLKEDLQSIHFASLLQTNINQIQQTFAENEDKTNALSMALTLYYFQMKTDSNLENNDLYQYLHKEKKIHPKLIRCLLKDRKLVQYKDENKQLHYAFLYKNEDGHLTNISDYSVNPNVPMQKWGMNSYALEYKCEKEIKENRVLCFSNMIELLSYQSLMLEKNIPLSQYTYLSLEENDIVSSLEKYCQHNENKRITFMMNQKGISEDIKDKIQILKAKYPTIRFDQYVNKKQLGISYNQILQNVSKKKEEKER